MRIRTIALAFAVAATLVLPGAAAAETPAADSHEYGEMVDYPMLFPVAEGASYTYFTDTFWASRTNGIHHATDIMAPKMTPIIAPVDGTIGYVNWSSNPNQPNWDRCCTLTINHDDGWSSWYIHLNNDTPGTDDGQAWGIAPGISQGVHVHAGQLIGWVGDSGNAENTGPHLHFELRDPEGTIVNPYQSLVDATRVTLPKCLGKAATLMGTSGDDVLIGTVADDVIIGLGGDDVIEGNGGNDRICAGTGADVVDGGPGKDRINGGAGDDVLKGGRGNDVLLGKDGEDRLVGERGADVLKGGPGKDVLKPGNGDDRAYGNGGRDRFIASRDTNELWGGVGRDTADYNATPTGVAVDLGLGTSTGYGTDVLHDIEDVNGSPMSDILVGDELRNILRGRAGDDTISGMDGNDRLSGGGGTNEIDGGDGIDKCLHGFSVDCEIVPS